MLRAEALAILSTHLDELRSRFGVTSLALFGSVARDKAGPKSDVDLLVEFERPVGFFEVFDLKEYLQRLLGRPVDLGTPESLKERLRPYVLKDLIRVA